MHNQAIKQTCKFHRPDGTMRCQGAFLGDSGFRPAAGTYRPRQFRRRGVSLLEVMFSIGIVMIGLLGVAALLPLAGFQISKGVIADHAASLGRAAVHDFQVRGMADPSNWRVDGIPQPVLLENIDPRESFCIDPRGNNAIGPLFPYGAPWQMRRINLASGVVLPSGFTPGMNQLQADQLFMSQDELVFDLPGDRTLGPVQNFGINNEKRQTKGRMSWMATLVPKLDRQGNSIREYTLFVVVFSQRVLDTESERVALVATFHAGNPAWGGGDMLLSDDLELREGDWVMLSTTKSLDSSGLVLVHKWYRVVAVDESGLEVTLVGPDWDREIDLNTTLDKFPTQVTAVRGVVSVFEKTIRLGTSNLWTN